MSTSRRTWQKGEQKVAAIFGASRQRCSGSSGRPDCSRSDSTHDVLFIETKLRQTHSARTLLDSTDALAKRENKIPVVALLAKGRPRIVICCYADDLPAIAKEYHNAIDQELPVNG